MKRAMLALFLYSGAVGGAVAFVGFTVFPQAGAGNVFWALLFGALFGGYEASQRLDSRAFAGRFVAIAAGVSALAIIAAGVSCAALGRCL